MRVLLFGNNWVGWQIASFLKESGEEIVGVVLHPSGRRRFGDEILRATGCEPDRIFDGSRLSSPETLMRIKELAPEIGVSAMFGYILRDDLLRLFPAGCVNVHTSFLPFNRGAYPNVWSIVDGTPAGVTIHYIDEGVDTGDIISQREVEVSMSDTGATLQNKLERASVDLFGETWSSIKSGRAERVGQTRESGTSHRVKDVESIDRIDLEREYRARDLINILRARTFAPYAGAYIISEGHKIYIRVDLIPEESLSNEANGSGN